MTVTGCRLGEALGPETYDMLNAVKPAGEVEARLQGAGARLQGGQPLVLRQCREIDLNEH